MRHFASAASGIVVAFVLAGCGGDISNSTRVSNGDPAACLAGKQVTFVSAGGGAGPVMNYMPDGIAYGTAPGVGAKTTTAFWRLLSGTNGTATLRLDRLDGTFREDTIFSDCRMRVGRNGAQLQIVTRGLATVPSDAVLPTTDQQVASRLSTPR